MVHSHQLCVGWRVPQLNKSELAAAVERAVLEFDKAHVRPSRHARTGPPPPNSRVCLVGLWLRVQAVYPAVAVTSSETGFGVQPLRELMVQAAMLDMWTAFPEDDPGLSSDDEAALADAGVGPSYSDVGGHVVRRRAGYAGGKDTEAGQMSSGMGRRGPDLPPIMLMDRRRKPTPKAKRKGSKARGGKGAGSE